MNRTHTLIAALALGAALTACTAAEAQPQEPPTPACTALPELTKTPEPLPPGAYEDGSAPC